MGVFYVYIYFRLNGIPCYVGKGKDRRWKRHESFAYNPHLAAIIKQAGGFLPRVKIRENLSEADAFATEIALIAAIGREVHGGPLVNMTDGGEGSSGYVYTKEDCDRVSAGLKGKPKSAAHIQAVVDSLKSSEKFKASHIVSGLKRRGRKASPETCARQSAATLGKKRGPYSLSHCAAISAGKRGKKRPPATDKARKNMSDAAKKAPRKPQTATTREKLSKIVTEFWAIPENREKLIKKRRARSPMARDKRGCFKKRPK